MTNLQCRAPRAVDPLPPGARAAEHSEDGEIFDSDDDDDLFSLRQTLASLKQVTEVIDLTSDEDDDGEGGDDDILSELS